MCETVSADATAGALQNHVVLQEIFKYLPTSSLLSCSRVSQLWTREARSFIRDYRECTIFIGKDEDAGLWKTFLQLEQILQGMKVVPFNSLCIFFTKEHVEFDEEADAYGLTNLMTKFPLKFLSVYEAGGRGSCSVPAASAIFELVRRNSSVLLEIEIQCGINNGLFDNWDPPEKFENLKKLSIAENSSVTAECAKKIILGAPKLRAIHNCCLHMIRDNVVPQNMYGTFKRLAFQLKDINTVENIVNKLDHVEELIVKEEGWLGPKLPSDEDANKRRFIQFVRKLIALNFRTLCSVDLRFQDVSLFSQLELPTLPSVKNMYLTVFKISESLAHIMSINFPRTFPNLHKVRIHQCVLDDNTGSMDPDEDITVTSNASLTTMELFIEYSNLASNFVALRRLFPNVIQFTIKLFEDSKPLGLISNLWPNLRMLSIETGSLQIVQEFGAQVFGLHPEELELLEGQESLEPLQIPPICPCVRTLKELEQFQVDFSSRVDREAARRFLKLVETLLVGRRPGLIFKMEPECDPPNNYMSWDIPRFGDLFVDCR